MNKLPEVGSETENAGHANQSFRFAQLSDPHLSDLSNAKLSQLCNKRILGYLSWLKKRRKTHQRWVLDLATEKIHAMGLDHIVFTGDMTHIGLAGEFAQVTDWLDQQSSRFDISLVPGNHDLYVDSHWRDFFKHWLPYMQSDSTAPVTDLSPHRAERALNELFPTLRIRSDVAIIGLSSAYAAPWFFATGKVHANQVHRLRKLLCSEQVKNRYKVLVLHHPPKDGIVRFRKSLLANQELVACLQDHPVDLILHGHNHKQNIAWLSSGSRTKTPIISTASCSSTDQEHRRKAEFRVFEIKKELQDWTLLTQSFVLNHQRNTFEPESPKTELIAE